MTARAADVTRTSCQPGSVVLRAMLAHNVGVHCVQNAVCWACACVRVHVCVCLLSWGQCGMVTRVRSVLEGLEVEPSEGLCPT